MNKERLIVIGGDAAGMSAASQALRTAKRRGRELSMVVLERGAWTSYSACGIPYWVAGDVDSPDDLIARTPDEHRANARARVIDWRTHQVAYVLNLKPREQSNLSTLRSRARLPSLTRSA